MEWLEFDLLLRCFVGASSSRSRSRFFEKVERFQTESSIPSYQHNCCGLVDLRQNLNILKSKRLLRESRHTWLMRVFERRSAGIIVEQEEYLGSSPTVAVSRARSEGAEMRHPKPPWKLGDLGRAGRMPKAWVRPIDIPICQ